MFIAEKVGKEWTMDQAPQYAIDHVANSKKNIFEFDFLNSLSAKISNFFGISNESLFYIDLGISKHVFLLFFVSFIVVSTIVTLIQGYISHKKNIPNKFMSIIEMFVIYLRDDVLKNFIGDKEYRSWAPLVYTIFFFVLFGNVLGLIPIFDLTGLNVLRFTSKLINAVLIFLFLNLAINSLVKCKPAVGAAIENPLSEN